MTAQSAKEELESMGKKYGEDEMAATESANKLSIENYPNPFNPDTHIQFTLPEEGQVTAAIYNSMGQEVTTLLHEKLAQGKHSIQWNGKDHNGRPVVSGVYFYQIRFQDQLLARKMLLIR
jgi:flagellar hook assembly protein FlgD